jgi:hypothetical protein
VCFRQTQLHGGVGRIQIQGQVELESGVYEPLSKDFITKVEMKVLKLLPTHKTALPADLKHKLTLCQSKPPYLYGLPNIHKQNIPLRSVVSSTGSPCYTLAGPLAGNSESFVKKIQREDEYDPTDSSWVSVRF